MLKIILPLFLLLFSSLCFAKVNFRASQQVLMSGASCEELSQHTNAIMDWSKIITNSEREKPECFCSSKSCQVDVAKISPSLVKNVTNFNEGISYNTAYDGPNCFNLALVSSGTLPHIRYVHPYEMTAILSSSLCSERSIDEVPQPGDLLVVRDQSQDLFEVHAGVYINEKLSFSKYGESKIMDYSYGLDVHKTYGVYSESCRRIDGEPKSGDECYEQPYVNIFSCQSMPSFISKLFNDPGGINESVQEVYAQTSSYDLKVSNIAFKGKQVNIKKLQQYAEKMRQLSEETARIMSDVKLNADNQTLVRLMRFRIYSIYYQLRIIFKERGERNLPSIGRPKL